MTKGHSLMTHNGVSSDLGYLEISIKGSKWEI